MPRKFDKNMKPLTRHVSRETMQRIEEEREGRAIKKRVEVAKAKLIGQGFVMDKFKNYAKQFK